jgi:hypothetical protein
MMFLRSMLWQADRRWQAHFHQGRQYRAVNRYRSHHRIADSSCPRQAVLETVNGESLAPPMISATPTQWIATSKIDAGSAFTVTLPAHSVSVITLDVEP